jgi:hypothetical protein
LSRGSFRLFVLYGAFCDVFLKKMQGNGKIFSEKSANSSKICLTSAFCNVIIYAVKKECIGGNPAARLQVNVKKKGNLYYGYLF